MKRGLLKVKVLVKGKKLNYLPEMLRRRNITVYNVDNKGENSSIFTVDFNDLRKFFAICKNMCYNTKVKGYRGIGCLVAYAIKNLGVTLGLIIFTIISVVLDGYVYGITCIGSGAKLSNEIINIVNDFGIDKGDKFKDINYSALSNEILKSNGNFKFVSVYKRGNRLIIDSELSTNSATSTTPLTVPLKCMVNGTVESVKVLRGTATVNVGDKVSVGDVLIDAYVTHGEDERYPSAVLGVVTVLTEEVYFLESKIFSSEMQSVAIEKAKFLSDGEVVFSNINVTPNGYEVILTVRQTYYGG